MDGNTFLKYNKGSCVKQTDFVITLTDFNVVIASFNSHPILPQS